VGGVVEGGVDVDVDVFSADELGMVEGEDKVLSEGIEGGGADVDSVEGVVVERESLDAEAVILLSTGVGI
jgi:hypothetical protein